MGDVDRIERCFSSFKIIPINDDTLHSEGTGLKEIESWLPITESRKGNAYTAAFHLFSSAVGTPALVLPFAFTSLGWYVSPFIFIYYSSYNYF